MKINKEAKSLNMPWEKEYGYSQAVKVGDTIYLAGQVGHDDKGNVLGVGNMEVQMRAAYANIGKVLAQYGATMDNVVDEMLFVTDMDAAFAARIKMKQEVFSGSPVLGSTIVQIQRLAFPQLMIEIRCIARV
ncbi:MAG: Rid family hydrolase [Deltaproteobacteria bacterium]|nr:Rid family hydrolase [Deltaproteobacteria bacterium]MCZ6907793.1 Rid family hydrolase [Deltaproteobacteria bacterium]